jgi:hypothetical protein
MKFYDLELDIAPLVTEKATTVVVSGYLYEENGEGKNVKPLTPRIMTSGYSVRHPTDEHDPEVALQLAVGRAFQALGRRLERRANGLIKHHDDIRQLQAKKAAKHRYDDPSIDRPPLLDLPLPPKGGEK